MSFKINDLVILTNKYLEYNPQVPKFFKCYINSVVFRVTDVYLDLNVELYYLESICDKKYELKWVKREEITKIVELFK